MAVQVLGKVAYFNKGAYNSQTNYEINDVVSYNGSSYVSLNDNNQGNLPTNTNYWSVVAEKGDKGDTGKPFVIEKTYSTIESMVADYDNMNVNDYVMIQGSIEEQENATLWTKREVEVSPYKWAYLADFSGASGITGATPNIHIGTVTEGNEPSVTRRSGSSNENPILDFVLKTGAKGDTGATGNGISSFEKVSTSGLVDTYTISFTDGTSKDIDVTNGRGIVSITKTSSVDNVDTYTISYNDNTTSTFEVTNSEVTEEEFDDVVDELNYLYDDLPKVEGEGTSLTLDNTRKGKMSNVLRGNDLSQFTTTGKNLFDKNTMIMNYSLNQANGSLVRNDDFRTIAFKCEHNTIYTIQKLSSNRFTIGYSTDDDAIAPKTLTNIQNGGSNTTYTFTTNNDTNYVFIAISKITDDTRDLNELLNSIQIETGSTATDYEPYTGGYPSPNLDYPQDVHVVSGDNEIEINGKNFYDTSYRSSGGGITSSNCTVVLTNDIYSMTASGTDIYMWQADYTVGHPYQDNRGKLYEFVNNNYICTISNPNISKNFVTYYDSDLKVVGAKQVNSNTIPISISDKTNAKYFTLRIGNGSATVGTTYNFTVMLQSGTTATTYQPYESGTYPINLGTMELCKIGDYQDYIYKDNGKWYKHSEIDKIILNGSEVWELDTYSALAGNRLTCSNIGGSSFGGTIQTAKSNMVSYTPDVNNYGNYNNTFILRYINSKNRIDVISSLINNLTEWTNLLNQKNMVIYVPLATPTNTEITDQTLIAQLDNFEKAISYNNQTNISQENNDLPFIISASAFMSLKYLFGNLETRVSELEASEPSEL